MKTLFILFVFMIIGCDNESTEEHYKLVEYSRHQDKVIANLKSELELCGREVRYKDEIIGRYSNAMNNVTEQLKLANK